MNNTQKRQAETQRRLAAKSGAGQGEAAPHTSQRSFSNFDLPINPAEIYALFETPETCLSRRVIAARIGRSKSPSLLAAITRLIDEGLLKVYTQRLPNGVDMYLYSRALYPDEQQAP